MNLLSPSFDFSGNVQAALKLKSIGLKMYQDVASQASTEGVESIHKNFVLGDKSTISVSISKQSIYDNWYGAVKIFAVQSSFGESEDEGYVSVPDRNDITDITNTEFTSKRRSRLLYSKIDKKVQVKFHRSGGPFMPRGSASQNLYTQSFGMSWHGAGKRRMSCTFTTATTTTKNLSYFIGGEHYDLTFTIPTQIPNLTTYECKAICYVDNNDLLKAQYPEHSMHKRLVIGLWQSFTTTTIKHYFTVIGNSKPFGGAATVFEIALPSTISTETINNISGFTDDGKSVCISTLVNGGVGGSIFSQKLMVLTFDELYTSYTTTLVYDDTIASVNSTTTHTETVGTPTGGGGFIGGSISDTTSASYVPGNKPEIINIKPEGKLFSALRFNLDSYSSSFNSTVNSTNSSSTSSGSSGYHYDLIKIDISSIPKYDIIITSEALSHNINSSDVIVNGTSRIYSMNYTASDMVLTHYYSSKKKLLLQVKHREVYSESGTHTVPFSFSLNANRDYLITKPGNRNTIVDTNIVNDSSTTSTLSPSYLFSEPSVPVSTSNTSLIRAVGEGISRIGTTNVPRPVNYNFAYTKDVSISCFHLSGVYKLYNNTKTLLLDLNDFKYEVLPVALDAPLSSDGTGQDFTYSISPTQLHYL